MMAASTTEPPVGASTCASGNHVCTGHIGTFTEKAARKPRNSHFCTPRASGNWCHSRMDQVPDWMYR